MISLYGCKEVKNGNGELQTHEGYFFLTNHNSTKDWSFNINYTRDVLMEQIKSFNCCSKVVSSVDWCLSETRIIIKFVSI